jgi:1,4-alpha-glucan branching enzyme|tara:strand:- start:271 stop:528 length:258 start_codon:yes stop_codon:yes gene_type:complete
MKKTINFQLLAPGAEQVGLAGTFNDWDPAARVLKRGKGDVFRTWMNLPDGTHEYRFIVDSQWREDPACDQHKSTHFGGNNSVLSL